MTTPESVRWCELGCGNQPAPGRRICDRCRAALARHTIPPGVAKSAQRRLAIQGFSPDQQPIFSERLHAPTLEGGPLPSDVPSIDLAQFHLRTAWIDLRSDPVIPVAEELPQPDPTLDNREDER